MTSRKQWFTNPAMKAIAGLVTLSSILSACTESRSGTRRQTSDGEGQSLTVYSGRQEELVKPIFERFEKSSGIELKVKYGSTAELAATILEEADASPADVFLAQDAGALGAVAKKDAFKALPENITSRVPAQYRSPQGQWVGITGRARTVVYNTDQLTSAQMPESILDFTQSAWRDKIGWAPTNGSFQGFVTALRKLKGDDAARDWLAKVRDNGAKEYEANIPIVEAVSSGEIEVGLVNHYYAVQMKKDNPNLKAANHFFTNQDPGGLVNVSGAGVLKSSKAPKEAERFIALLLSHEGQNYWGEAEFEYPLASGAKAAPELPPLNQLQAPNIDLSDLDDLEGTLEMLRQVRLL